MEVLLYNLGTGRLIIQICKNIGAKIVASTTSAEKIKGIKELGVDYVFLKDDLVKEVANIGLVDCVFDGVGKDTFEVFSNNLDFKKVLETSWDFIIVW